MDIPGTLYIVATPIGNLEDITLRALRILKEVDIIAAEDTREAIKILNYFGIKKRIISYHSNNKESSSQKIVSYLQEGKNVALISDSGTPLISDPGDLIVKQCANLAITVSAIPGPCALIAGLVVSGLDTSRFIFEGFLPVNKKKKITKISLLKEEQRTVVLYEAPHKLSKTLKDLLDVLGDRNIVLAREITKKYEEVQRTTLSKASEKYSYESPRGEFILIIEGSKESHSQQLEHVKLDEYIQKYIDQGFSKSDTAKLVAIERNMKKRDIYEYINKTYHF